MSDDVQVYIDQIKRGRPDLSALKEGVIEMGDPVKISEWAACYDPAETVLRGRCTVTVRNDGDIIANLGFVISARAGIPTFCMQESEGLNDVEITNSVSTNLYTTAMGDSVLSFVFGETRSGGKFLSGRVLPVGLCEEK